jgi:RNA polymerase sigma-70 factor (ECF subfamily)
VDDATLAQAAAHGEQNAFATLFERYRHLVYSIAWKITLNVEDSLDVTQNVFTRLAEKIGRYQGRGSFRSWLAAIAANEAVNILRRPERRYEMPTEPDIIASIIDEKHAGNNPSKTIETQERRELVEKAMAGLSPQQRAIFTLRWREEMTPAEIAERLGIPAGQVRSQICHAIAKIRIALPPETLEGKNE